MVLWSKSACKDAGRLCSGWLFRRKTDVPRLRIEGMDAMPPERTQDFADERPLVGLVELFAFGPKRRQSLGGEVRWIIEIGFAEIEDTGWSDNAHLDDLQNVVIINQVRQYKSCVVQ